MLIDRLTCVSTGELVAGGQTEKIGEIRTAVEFESQKRQGLIVGGEAMRSGKHIVMLIALQMKALSRLKKGRPIDARKTRNTVREAFRESLMEYIKSQKVAISPELESALLSGAKTFEPAVGQEYNALVESYVFYQHNMRK